MDITTRMELIQQVGEEILTLEELKTLLETNDKPIAYDGFESSGNIHIAQGWVRAHNINLMLKAGCRFKLLVADWFAWMNNKYGGDMEKIHTAGEYFVEVWKSCGLDTDKVEFVWSNEVMGKKDYWSRVVTIGRNSTLPRIMRTTQIMGRGEKDELSAAQIFYPCMQCADIFELDVDICQLGMDQRKVNILARELGPKLFGRKPVAVHHHMLMGLQMGTVSPDADTADRAIALKMSKSRPESAIFMTDSVEDVTRKIKNAYCPEKQTHENPIIDYCKHIVFAKQGSLHIERPAKFGGSLDLNSFEELCSTYEQGKLHPMDLKTAVGAAVNELLEPTRKHFSKGKPAKLLEQVKSFAVTR